MTARDPEYQQRSSGGGGPPLRTAAVHLLLATAFVPFVYWTGVLYPAATTRAVVFRVLVQLAGLSVLLLFALRRERVRFRGDPFLWCFLVFVGVSLLTALTGLHPARSLFGTMERMWGVITWAHFLLFYLLLRTVLDEAGWMRFFRVSLMVSVAVCLAGLGGHYADALGLPAFVGREPRILGTLGNPGYLAVYVFLHFALAAWLWTRTTGPWRIVCAVAAALHVWVYLLTETRAILLAAVGAAVLLGLVVGTGAAVRRARRRLAARAESSGPGTGRGLRRIGLAAVGVVGLGAGLATTLPGGTAELRRLPGAERLEEAIFDRSLGLRFLAWDAALEGFRERPLLGAGPENFRAVYNRHFDPDEYRVRPGSKQFDRVHNAFLEVLTASGLPGAVAYLGMWAALLLGLYRGWRSGRLATGETVIFAWALLGYGIYMVFWFEDHASTILFVAFAAYLWHQVSGRTNARPDAADRGFPSSASSSSSGSSRSISPLFGLLFLLALPAAALTTHSQGVRVLGAAHAARSAETAPDPWTAVDRYRTALSYGVTQTPEIAVELSRHLAGLSGWMAVRAKDPSAAERVDAALETGMAALGRAIDGDPDHVHLRIRRSLLARIAYRIFGREPDFLAAEADLRRALEVGPRRIRLHHLLAELYLLRGDHERALSVLDEAASIYDRFGETPFYRAKVRFAMGEREGAVRELRRAFSMGYAHGGSRFLLEVGEWLENESRHAEAAALYRMYLALKYPHLHPYDPSRENPRFYALPDRRVAFHLPLVELRAGDRRAAFRAARRLSRQLPEGHPASADRGAALRRFIEDVERGRGDRWREAWWIGPEMRSP